MAYTKSSSGSRDKRDFMYHGKLSDRGPVRITVDAKWRQAPAKLAKCKFGLVDITIHGEDGGPVTYWCESEACASFFTDDLVGKTFTVVAEGSRDEAIITYVGEPAAAVPAPAPAPAPPRTAAPRTTSPASQPGRPAPAAPTADGFESSVVAACKRLGRLGTAIELSADQTVRTISSFMSRHGLPVTPDMAVSVAQQVAEKMTETTFTTMFIELNKNGLVDGLPTTNVQKYLDAIKARQQTAAPKPAQPPMCKCGQVLLENGECPVCDAIPN